MKRYLFLLSWVDGSDSADTDTHVHKQDDLLPQFKADNEAILAVGVILPDLVPDSIAEELAANMGYGEAFSQNYTGYDTVSVCMRLEDSGVDGFSEGVIIHNFSQWT